MKGIAALLVTRCFSAYFGSIFLRYLENTWQAKVFFATYFLQPSNNMGHNMFLFGKKGISLGVEKDLSESCKIPF